MIQDRRLRIAFVTNRFYPEVGGAEYNIYQQAKKLSENHDVTVFCPKRIAHPRCEHLDGFKIYRFFDLLNWRQRFPNLKPNTLCLEIFHKILFGNFDIIQCFPSLNSNTILALIAGKISRSKVILSSFDFLDYASLIKNKGIVKQEILRSYSPSWKTRTLLSLFDVLFALGEEEISFFKRYNRHVRFTPVPIAAEEFLRKVSSPKQKYGISENAFIFLCLGRVSEIKGQDIALKAYAKTVHSLPQSYLVFVGRIDYEPLFYQHMKAFVSAHALTDRVIFTEEASREEVLGWLQHANIHLIPVRFMNGGAVVVESWASALPVLQSDAVSPNLVKEGVNGYSFASEDIDSLARQMLRVWKEKNHLPLMGEEGKKLVLEKYTYDALVKIYEHTYERILSNNYS